MLCLPGFGTHANTQNRPHFRAFPAFIQEQCPPKCLFFMANAKLPNRPGFALLRGGGGIFSEECQKPQPPLPLKKVSQYTPHLYCNTPPICIAVLSVPLRSEERETWSVLLPFVSQYASHLYCNTPPIRIAVLLRKSWWLWSPECSPYLKNPGAGILYAPPPPLLYPPPLGGSFQGLGGGGV